MTSLPVFKVLGILFAWMVVVVACILAWGLLTGRLP